MILDLRPARSTDAGSVGEILSDFIDTTGWMPRVHSRAQDLAHAGEIIARGWVTIAQSHGTVIGFSACDRAELNALYVRAGQRGQGAGGALLNHVRMTAPRLTLWTFQANVAAQRFYLRQGFTEVARTDGACTDEKLPDIRFEWSREAA